MKVVERESTAFCGEGVIEQPRQWHRDQRAQNDRKDDQDRARYIDARVAAADG